MKKQSLGHIPSLSDIDNLCEVPKRFIPLPNSNQMILITSERQICHSLREIEHYINNQDRGLSVNQEDNVSIDQHNLDPQFLTPNKTPSRKKKGGCVCKKTNCLKLYCECFASGKLCTQQCVCCRCCNIETKTDVIQQARGFRKSKTNIGDQRRCNCRKSNCQKKYCECFNAGLPCGPQCNCCQCHNMLTKDKIEQGPPQQFQEHQCLTPQKNI